MSEKKGIYPWIKSLFKRKKDSPAECVYAGPSYFERKDKEKPVPCEDVYAGPEYFDGNGGPPEEAPVYAGPEYPDEPDEKGDDNDPICEDVYAGPEYFGSDPDDPEEAPEEEKEMEENNEEKRVEGVQGDDTVTPPIPGINKDDLNMMQGVYAGPAVYPGGISDPRASSQLFMMVYAGPAGPVPYPQSASDTEQPSMHMFMAAYAGPPVDPAIGGIGMAPVPDMSDNSSSDEELPDDGSLIKCSC